MTHAGVLVVASAQMAVKLSAGFHQLAVPDWLIERIEHERGAGHLR
jgi:hypothetical protein